MAYNCIVHVYMMYVHVFICSCELFILVINDIVTYIDFCWLTGNHVYSRIWGYICRDIFWKNFYDDIYFHWTGMWNLELNAMYYLTLRLNELEILVTVASSDSREVLYSPFSTLLTKILQTRHAISKETN